MKYLCLVYFEQKVLDDLSASEDAALARESIAYDDDLRRNGHYVASAALQPVRSATTVRMRGDKLSMTDGPFAETREIMGGFIYIDARDLNEALRIAGNIPMARLGTIEVRPVQSFDGEGARA
jgi:hypothetical protein